MMARIYCVDAGTGQGAMWTDELEVYDTGCYCRAVPMSVYRKDELIAWTGCCEVYANGQRVAEIRPERRQSVQFSLF